MNPISLVNSYSGRWRDVDDPPIAGGRNPAVFDLLPRSLRLGSSQFQDLVSRSRNSEASSSQSRSPVFTTVPSGTIERTRPPPATWQMLRRLRPCWLKNRNTTSGPGDSERIRGKPGSHSQNRAV